ncbi:chemotaxis protein CheA [Erythrobacter crassostreae]|uniref:Chemotaxis protein CheA n=1 Tax=Erythrobacter crassostreae TaxID=2828328 RepID=A0A9X1JP67_9SPHN|nr:chemotaxis protein CheA [Erythrobacter crassostrea]MBV7259117.1 chemotaxis protein CheA [Erythrobacter crassostrea]
MDDLLADFVAETREMLEASEGEIIAWEADPSDSARIDTIFRFVHTVKGNCGFFDFPRLAGLSHAAEDALADCRAGRREPDAALVTAVLAIIDRIALMVDAIEAGEELSAGGDEELIAALNAASEDDIIAVETAPAHSPASTILEGCDAFADEETAKRPDCPAAVQRSIRLPVDLLDRVMSGVSDMVLARNDLGHRLRQAGTQPTIDGPFERLTTILSDVRDAITRMRMQRIETVFAALPRLVRDLSADLGKQVMVDLEGGDVELDREMVEMVRDPLTHIIRNAIDHGMEVPSDRLKNGKREIGLLSIAARQSGNTISIVVSDDGRGLDEEKIAAKAVDTGLITASQRTQMGREAILQLIFEPGFSTADEVSNVSGRGVGLDVVRANLQKVGGSIKVSSQPGVGTLFTLQIPLTLSIIAGLTVEIGEQRFAIPQSYVEEIIHSSAKALDFTRVGETALVTFRGQRVPCLMLTQVLGLDVGDIDERDQTMVLLRLASGDLFALAVDRIHTHGDLVVKPLAPAVMSSGFYAGSTLLDDGQPILLLDVTNIASNYGLVSDARTRVLQTAEETDSKAGKDISRAMLFTDFHGRRCAVRLELVKRIETAPASAIDRTSASPRAVIDNAILPLIGLPDGPFPAEKVRFLRLSDGDSELLQAVREIDDAVELTEKLKPVTDDPLIEAVTLVGDQTVSLVDGHELFARYGEPPEITAKPICRLPGSEWSRSILGPLVTSAGYDIADESSEPKEDGSEICIMLEEEYEAAAALEMPIADKVIRLRSLPQETPGEDTIYRYDRDALVAALHKARAAGGNR